MSQILDTSIAILLWKRLHKWYASIEWTLIDIYHSSQTYSIINKFWQKTKVCFRYSFWGRITETKQVTPGVLDNSRVVQYLFDFYKRWKGKIINYLSTSSTVGLAKDTKKELYFSPVRISSLILVTMILVNAVLSVIWQQQIDLWGFLIRMLFLFAGTAGLSCQADWPTVKENSVFLRKNRDE